MLENESDFEFKESLDSIFRDDTLISWENASWEWLNPEFDSQYRTKKNERIEYIWTPEDSQ